MHSSLRFTWQHLLACLVCLLSGIEVHAAVEKQNQLPRRVIIFVWDGLRPDLISVQDTPNLARLRDEGVNFTDHHSTYPTLTMINASSLATGAYPATHGFFGNVFWVPKAVGRDSSGREVDFTAPIFTEDYGILKAIDRAMDGKLLEVPTLFELAHQRGMVTAIVGKGGPTFLQSRGVTDFFMDDRTVMPLSAVSALNAAGYPLPALWSKAYSLDPVPDYRVVGNLSASNVVPLMNDGMTTDASREDAVANVMANAYQANVFINYVLPKLQPQLSMLWLKNPDSTEHAFGPGSFATRNAIRANDSVLGTLLNKLDELGWRDRTNIIVVSDHGHSHISGAFEHFPLRKIFNGDVGEISSDGYSVSGEVRSADLLRRAGLLAFDGSGAQCNPVMSGIKADGTSIYTRQPAMLTDACTRVATTGDFRIPGADQLRQPYAVIALDGGSEYYYVSSHDRGFVEKLVHFFQTHEQYGAVFVDDKRYGEIAGTLSLSLIHMQNTGRGSPDIIVSFAFDANAKISNVSGIEYCGCASSNRGMHGSFSPRDVHNVLIASGADFKRGLVNKVASGNIDVAPTVAYLLGFKLEKIDGRVLFESLLNAGKVVTSSKSQLIRSRKPATGLKIIKPTDPNGQDIDATRSTYAIELQTKVVKQKANGAVGEYRYFDSATAVRQ